MKVALITGAGSGIGKACSLALLNAGYHVVLAGRRPAPLDQLVIEAGEQGKNALAVPTDVSNPKSVEVLFSGIQDRFGRLDLLFNNAGIGAPAVPLEELTYQQWKLVLEINLGGAFLCTQYAFKLMKAQQPKGGRIINNGSISAHVPRPFSAPYTASKHGMTGLTKSTNLDGRAYDIVCGQIDIGNAETDMAAKMKKGVPQADGSIAIEPTISVDRVVDAFMYMAELPLDTNVPFMTVMANEMPYMGRG